MKSKITQTLITLLILAAFSAPVYSQDLPWIKVEGNHFVTENGEKIIFKALNASDPDKLEKDGHWDQESSRFPRRCQAGGKESRRRLDSGPADRAALRPADWSSR